MSFFDEDMGFFEKVAFSAFAVVASPFYIATVACEKITGNKENIDEPKQNTKLLDGQYRRIKVRKEAVTQLLSKHRNRINAQLEGVIKRESFYIGNVSIDMSNDTTYKAKFTDLDKSISCLNMANDIVLGRSITSNNSIPSLQLIPLKSANSSLVDEIIKKADSDYGSLAGIDSYDNYVESKDLFLDALKKMKTI